MNELTIPVLDHGYVRLADSMGSDLEVVNDAKASFDKQSVEVGPREERLIEFLAEHDHSSPFRHSIVKFEVFAPLMVTRQWWKYVIGSDHAEEPTFNLDRFLAWNESSRRYISDIEVFYLPAADAWRGAPDNRKQGSSGFIPLEAGTELTALLEDTIATGQARYERAIELGVAVEQARLFLPAYALYIRWRWTSSLQGVLHFCQQRLAHEAQAEIRQYAAAVRDLCAERFPVATRAWTEKRA